MDTSGSIVDCDFNILDSDTMEITVMYDEDDKYETYLVSVDYEFEEDEPQTYDYPGYSGGAIGTVDGVKMTHPENRELSSEEANELLDNEYVNKCISGAMEDMERDAYENRSTGPDPDDEYDRSREDY